MALINCPECKRGELSDKAAACPDCHCPIAQKQKGSEYFSKLLTYLPPILIALFTRAFLSFPPFVGYIASVLLILIIIISPAVEVGLLGSLKEVRLKVGGLALDLTAIVSPILVLLLLIGVLIFVNSPYTENLDPKSQEAGIAQNYCEGLTLQNYPGLFDSYQQNGHLSINNQSFEKDAFINLADQTDRQEGNVVSCTLPKTEISTRQSCEYTYGSLSSLSCHEPTHTLNLAIERKKNGNASKYQVTFKISGSTIASIDKI